MSSLSEKLASGIKVITAEITPPKGAGIKRLLKNLELIKPHVDAINITDCQRGFVRMSSLAACKILLERGVEPVYQLTCRDRNRIALQSDLMGASALGIRNLLCLTGDPVAAGDHPRSKPVFEVEALGLLEMVGHLQAGTDFQGNKMNAHTKFFVGAVVNPTLRSNKSQLLRMEKKVQAGAQFFQTQANYELDDFTDFLGEAGKLHTKVLAGILLLPSYEMATYIHENLPGVRVPESLRKQLVEAPNPTVAGIDFAVETMLRLEFLCQGFHLMSVRAEELIPQVLEKYHAKRKLTEDRAVSIPSAVRR